MLPHLPPEIAGLTPGLLSVDLIALVLDVAAPGYFSCGEELILFPVAMETLG
jgi:hypothetical protein